MYSVEGTPRDDPLIVSPDRLALSRIHRKRLFAERTAEAPGREHRSSPRSHPGRRRPLQTEPAYRSMMSSASWSNSVAAVVPTVVVTSAGRRGRGRDRRRGRCGNSRRSDRLRRRRGGEAGGSSLLDEQPTTRRANVTRPPPSRGPRLTRVRSTNSSFSPKRAHEKSFPFATASSNVELREGARSDSSPGLSDAFAT